MFSPGCGSGVVLAGVAAVLFVVGPARSIGGAAAARSDTPKQVRGRKAEPVEGSAIVDDDMADIEAILRNRGIT